jgi:hypothetical protein
MQDKLVDRAVALQEQNVRFALGMALDGPIEVLHWQAESNQGVVKALAEHSRRQTEASQDLLLGVVDAYMALFFTPLSDRR